MIGETGLPCAVCDIHPKNIFWTFVTWKNIVFIKKNWQNWFEKIQNNVNMHSHPQRAEATILLFWACAWCSFSVSQSDLSEINTNWTWPEVMILLVANHLDFGIQGIKCSILHVDKTVKIHGNINVGLYTYCIIKIFKSHLTKPEYSKVELSSLPKRGCHGNITFLVNFY